MSAWAQPPISHRVPYAFRSGIGEWDGTHSSDCGRVLGRRGFSAYSAWWAVSPTQWVSRSRSALKLAGCRPARRRSADAGQHKQQRGRRPADRDVGVAVTVLPRCSLSAAFDEPLAGLAETRLVAGVQVQGLPATAKRLGGVRPLGCPSWRGHHRQVVGDRVGGEPGVEVVGHTGGGGRIGAVNARLPEDPRQPKSCSRPSVSRRVPHWRGPCRHRRRPRPAAMRPRPAMTPMRPGRQAAPRPTRAAATGRTPASLRSRQPTGRV